MTKVKKIQKDEDSCLPLEGGGWGMLTPAVGGILVTLDLRGVFISDSDLKKLGYIRMLDVDVETKVTIGEKEKEDELEVESS